ncbi:MAG: hypothetical protein KF689_04395 [Gemmatimonadaceae bacterium]|nr:hypothetical protein [Gemmatimonadaceae bacterium]MCW5825586.1 hypothetical protein [Gemmatimonadaceae bacterium]
MFAMVFRTQWRWTRLTVGGFALLAFLFPALAWRLGSGIFQRGEIAVMEGFQALGPMLGFLALFGPFVLAAQPWTIDHETRHVYPLSLPIPWSRWVAMRFAAGALTLVLPAIALYLGAWLLLANLELPPLLRGYPGAMALRFLFACLIAYGATFALQYLAGKRAAAVFLALLVGVSLTLGSLALLGYPNVAESVGKFFFEWPGPLAIFVEPWTLIDV